MNTETSRENIEFTKKMNNQFWNSMRTSIDQTQKNLL